MMVSGKMVDNMAEVSTSLNKDNLEKVFGRMERESLGLEERQMEK